MKKLLVFLIVTFLANLLGFFLPQYWNFWEGYLVLLSIHLVVLLQAKEKLPIPDSPALELLEDIWPVGTSLGLISVCVLSGLGFPFRTCAGVSILCVLVVWLLSYGVVRLVRYYTDRLGRPV